MCLEATSAAVDAGFRPKAVNIGGGYRISHLADRGEWHRYVNAIKASAVGKGPRLEWNGGTFGYRDEGGVVRGAPSFNDHFESVCGADHLRHILQQPIATLGGMSASDYLRDMMLELYIEPGRSAFDQAGITLAAVNFRKQSGMDPPVVGLDINSSNIGSFWNKLMTDPIVIPRGRAEETAEGVFYAGNLCTPNDVITHHKTFPKTLPKPGDVVAFANTAAYLMDFFESATLGQRVAEKVAVVSMPGGQRWYRDEVYDPLTVKEPFA